VRPKRSTTAKTNKRIKKSLSFINDKNDDIALSKKSVPVVKSKKNRTVKFNITPSTFSSVYDDIDGDEDEDDDDESDKKTKPIIVMKVSNRNNKQQRNRSNRPPSSARARRLTKKKRDEAEMDRLIREGMKKHAEELKEIENYKLVVEIVDKDI
jgi:hypothetical protein